MNELTIVASLLWPWKRRHVDSSQSEERWGCKVEVGVAIEVEVHEWEAVILRVGLFIMSASYPPVTCMWQCSVHTCSPLTVFGGWCRGPCKERPVKVPPPGRYPPSSHCQNCCSQLLDYMPADRGFCDHNQGMLAHGGCIGFQGVCIQTCIVGPHACKPVRAYIYIYIYIYIHPNLLVLLPASGQLARPYNIPTWIIMHTCMLCNLIMIYTEKYVVIITVTDHLCHNIILWIILVTKPRTALRVLIKVNEFP